MGYVIGSQKGKEIAENLKKGESYKASDGSTWTKQSDGSVSVTHNGQVTNNAYKSSSGGSGGGSSKKNSQYSTGNYTIGSDAGKKQAQSMGIGSSWIASDGSEWVKENDGTISVYHNGTKTTGAYVPTDLGILGMEQVNAGVPYSYVEKTYQDRINKIKKNPELLQYVDDGTMQMMLNYINDQKLQEDLDKRLDIMNEGRPDAYESQYDPKMDALLTKILNREDFSYDVNNDPLYQQYAEQYQREGDRAMRETMAEAAAGAGGMNTYAITAAQQAQNYYGSQLNDKIPELYQLAYEMYLNDKESMVQDLGLLQNMDDRQYSRYRDTMNEFYNDRNFAYGAYNDAVEQGNFNKQFDYNSMVTERDFLYNDIWNNKQWDLGLEQWGVEKEKWDVEKDQINLENSRYDTEQAQKNVWALVEMGIQPDDALVQQSGLNPEVVKQAVAKAQLMMASGGGSGGGGRSGRSGGSSKSNNSSLSTGMKDTMSAAGEGVGAVTNTAFAAILWGDAQTKYKTEGATAAKNYLKEAYATGAVDYKTYANLMNKTKDWK